MIKDSLADFNQSLPIYLKLIGAFKHNHLSSNHIKIHILFRIKYGLIEIKDILAPLINLAYTLNLTITFYSNLKPFILIA